MLFVGPLRVISEWFSDPVYLLLLVLDNKTPEHHPTPSYPFCISSPLIPLPTPSASHLHSYPFLPLLHLISAHTPSYPSSTSSPPLPFLPLHTSPPLPFPPMVHSRCVIMAEVPLRNFLFCEKRILVLLKVISFVCRSGYFSNLCFHYWEP